MKRWLLGAVLALAASAASAGPCFPPGALAPINLQGKNYLEGYHPTHKGTWRAIWCSTGAFSDTTGQEVWRLYTHAVLDKYATLTTASLLDIVTEILFSEDPIGLLTSSIKNAEYIPPTGTQDRFDWESLRYIACLEARKFPPYPVSTTPIGGACTPPTPMPASDVWRTPPTGTFTLFTVSNGRLASIVAGVKALPNTECLCSVNSVLSGSSRYCPTDQAQPNRVTYCVKQK